MAERKERHPEIIWEAGTAYDFFASLHVLHHPGDFGLRGAWAAGVRSRLTQEQRELLEEVFAFLFMPNDWIMTLPEPKDADTVLYALKQLPPDERLPTLLASGDKEMSYRESLYRVADAGTWAEEDREVVLTEYQKHGEKGTSKKVEGVLNLWAKARVIGDDFLKALQAYQDAFFAQEEKRLQTKLEEALHLAQQRSQELPLSELLGELSRGLDLDWAASVSEVVLIPSYWITPLIVEDRVSDERFVMMFGARSPDDSLVPGEVVPDSLLLALKALADPTRLRILRYLVKEELTPAELSRRLRLRAPTVTHHLHALRLAELVSFAAKNKQERLYSARLDAINAVYAALNRFLEASPIEDIDELEEIEVFERGQTW